MKDLLQLKARARQLEYGTLQGDQDETRLRFMIGAYAFELVCTDYHVRCFFRGYVLTQLLPWESDDDSLPGIADALLDLVDMARADAYSRHIRKSRILGNYEYLSLIWQDGRVAEMVAESALFPSAVVDLYS